jgi:hypothetical protein
MPILPLLLLATRVPLSTYDRSPNDSNTAGKPGYAGSTYAAVPVVVGS